MWWHPLGVSECFKAFNLCVDDDKLNAHSIYSARCVTQFGFDVSAIKMHITSAFSLFHWMRFEMAARSDTKCHRRICAILCGGSVQSRYNIYQFVGRRRMATNVNMTESPFVTVPFLRVYSRALSSKVIFFHYKMCIDSNYQCWIYETCIIMNWYKIFSVCLVGGSICFALI